MSFLGRWIPGALAAIVLVAVNGCSPSEPSPQDEEKEPHFVLGNSRFNGMEWDKAIEAFQESLEVNPHSAQAHYRLAQLFDTKCPNPASAIYHYEEYLRLNPTASNAEVIRQRVITCKQQLAADVMSMPTAPHALREIEDLTATNRLLQLQVEQLNASVKQWSTYAGSLQAAAKNNPAPQLQSQPYDPAAPYNPGPAAAPAGGSLVPAQSRTTPAVPPRHTTTSSRPTAHANTHAVQSGETLASIARKQGISLTALQAANPDVSPKKLRVGQTLNLP